jgi:MFS family permease
MTRSRLLTTLGALYLAQGLPFGFFSQALPVMLRRQGVSLELIGLSSLLALPWALKFLLAPTVDRRGRRRTWVLAMQAATVLVLLAAALLDATSTRWLLAVIALVNALAATQDIATDAVAVDLLQRSERGFANGLQVGAYRVGMIIGGGALLVAFEVVGWAGTFVIMAALVAVTTVPVLTLREPARTPGEGASLRGFFTRADAWPLLGVLFTFKFGEAFGVGMLRPRLVDLGYGLTELGVAIGTVGFAAGLVGAFAGGAWVGPLGRRRALMIFGGAQAAAVLAYTTIGPDTPRTLVVGAIALEHLCSGLATATLFTCIMDWSRASASATDSTVQASTVVIATGVATALSGVSAAHLGYPLHFALASVFAVLAVVIAASLFPRITQQESPCASASTPAASTP